MVEPNVRASLYAKIARVTAAVKRIPKNGFNKFFHYAYVMEGDVTEGLRDLLQEHGLAFLPPSVLSWERFDGQPKRNGERGDDVLRVQYRFVIADTETGETHESLWWSEAQDSGDKALNKAATAAVKYWLMKTFLIASEDDPDSSPEAEGPAEKAPARAPAPRPRPATATQRPAQNAGPLPAPGPIPAPNAEPPGMAFAPQALLDEIRSAAKARLMTNRQMQDALAAVGAPNTLSAASGLDGLTISDGNKLLDYITDQPVAP